MKIDINSKPGSSRENKTGGWRTYIPITDMQKCIGCSNCAKVCPDGVIEMIMLKGANKPKTDYDFCKGCGICAQECPVKAIRMELEKK